MPKPKPKKVAKKSKASANSAPQALFSAAFSAPKTIRASKIYLLWVQVLGRPIKSLDDSPDDYNIPNVIAYADFLNRTPQFSPYGLSLEQANVVNVDTMGKLGAAIVKDFQKRHWTVTPD
jgi:hypothetical protein